MVLRQLLHHPAGAGRGEPETGATNRILHPRPGARPRDPGQLLADAVVFVRGDRRGLAAGPLPLSACRTALHGALSGAAPTSRGGIPAPRAAALRQSFRPTPGQRTGCLHPPRSAPARPGRADGTATGAATCGGGRRGSPPPCRGRVRRPDEEAASPAGQPIGVPAPASTAPRSPA